MSAPLPRSRSARFRARAKQRQTRAKREGIVMLIVMLMLMMGTGTALFTMQATQYEQRASTSIAEANWARGVAECATMAALAYVENTTALPSGPGVGAPWLDTGSVLSPAGRKFSIPSPLFRKGGADAAPGAQPATSVSMDYPLSIPNTAGGARGFLPLERRATAGTSAQPFYPLRANVDEQGSDPLFAIPPADADGLRYMRSHWLQESLSVKVRASSNGPQEESRTRTIVTGFAEMHVWRDGLDTSGQRENHEIDAVARGYIDRVAPSN